MSFPAFNLLFPLVVCVHNAEEYRRLHEFSTTFHGVLPRVLGTRTVLRNAMILLTLSAAFVSTLTFLRPSGALLSIAKAAVLALMLNALGHALMSLRRRAWVPGAVSAVTLVLPYGAISLLLMHQGGDADQRLLWLAVAAALATPVLSSIFLGLGYAAQQLLAPVGR